jgi:hypothetical protein
MVSRPPGGAHREYFEAVEIRKRAETGGLVLQNLPLPDGNRST